MYGATERNQGTKVCGNTRLIVAAIVPQAARWPGRAAAVGSFDARVRALHRGAARVSSAPREPAAPRTRSARDEARRPRSRPIRYPEVAAGQRAARRDRARHPRASRWSSSAAKPARARRRSCPRSRSSSAAARGAGGGGLIGHTQPRRIAASSVAKRIAEELELAARRRGRLQGALPGPAAARRVGQADDRRHPARRDADTIRCCAPTTR